MKSSGMVPVFNHDDAGVCMKVLDACYEGGLRAFEFTNRSISAKEVFSVLRSHVDENLPDMLLGVGSVTNAEQTEMFIGSGADFIVSPGLVPQMAEVCNKEGIMWIPGCGTVSEILQAKRFGAEIVKIFPAAQLGGPAFIKAVLAPLPGTLLMPTGGVAPEYDNLKKWFDAGVCCVGIGSKLFPEEFIRHGDYQKITALVENTLAIIKQLRTN